MPFVISALLGETNKRNIIEMNKLFIFQNYQQKKYQD
jgi:hypothetical protein